MSASIKDLQQTLAVAGDAAEELGRPILADTLKRLSRSCVLEIEKIFQEEVTRKEFDNKAIKRFREEFRRVAKSKDDTKDFERYVILFERKSYNRDYFSNILKNDVIDAISDAQPRKRIRHQHQHQQEEIEPQRYYHFGYESILAPISLSIDEVRETWSQIHPLLEEATYFQRIDGSIEFVSQ